MKKSLMLLAVTLNLVSVLMFISSASCQTSFDTKAMPSWRIEDPAVIDAILTGLMLPKEEPRAIEIIDVNNNGIDDLDILIISPESRTTENLSGEAGYYQTYVMGDLDIPDTVKKIIQSIELGRKAEQTITVSSLEDALRFWSKMKTAKASIAVTVLTGLLQNYQESDYTLIVQRQPNGQFVFKMIGFDEEKTTPKSPWDPGKELPESSREQMAASEVLRAFFKELENKIKTEVLVIRSTRRDTVFLNQKK